MAEYLIEHGAEIDALNNLGETPLTMAYEFGNGMNICIWKLKMNLEIFMFNVHSLSRQWGGEESIDWSWS